MDEIFESVGDAATNRSADVVVVQRLLERNNVLVINQVPFPMLGARAGMRTGVCDHITIAYIETFQISTLQMRSNDPELGVVAPGSATIFALNGLSGGRQPLSRTGPVARLVYERRGTAGVGSGSDVQSVLTSLITDYIRGTGSVLESRSQRFSRSFRVNSVRIKTSTLTTTTIGGLLEQTTTETWLDWGFPQAQVSVTTERVRDGLTGVRNSSQSRQFRRAELDAILPYRR